jgi:spore germination cell wall hydrolase CwlJ-like protein
VVLGEGVGLRAGRVAGSLRALMRAAVICAAASALFAAVPVAAEERADTVVPAPFTSAVAMKRQAWRFDRLKAGEQQSRLTPDLLAAYVERQRKIQSFDGFDVQMSSPTLTEVVLMGYIAKRRNDALEAIETVDVNAQPALTPQVLLAYAANGYQPTEKKVKLAESEKLCLAQAIYHEARGESREGQLAVANVIINRAMSKKYPSTICGVVFQNADKGRYRCQFTFACDGRSDMGRERAAWNRSLQMAEDAFYEFQKGERPDVIPSSVMYYHTTAVAPRWSYKFKRVAAIGSHIFYAVN